MSHIQKSLFRKGYLWIKVKNINFDGVLKYGTLNKNNTNMFCFLQMIPWQSQTK